MKFDNQGIKYYDFSRWQCVMFDSNGKLLPPERQKHIDFNKVRDVGKASAIVLKAGQHNFKDVAFDTGWTNAKLAGLPRATYFFTDYRSTGKEQANKYWDIVKHDTGEGFLCADYETGTWSNWNELYNFISELQQLSGFQNDKIWIYSTYYFWLENSPRTDSALSWFADYPLWIAAYPPNSLDYSNVRVPRKWTDVVGWQNATYPIGFEIGTWSHEVDHNFLNGGNTEFRKYFGTPISPPTVTFPYSLIINNKEYK